MLEELEDIRARLAVVQKSGSAADRAAAREVVNVAARLDALAARIEARGAGAATAAAGSRPVPAREREPMVAEAQEKVDAMSADLAQLERRHRAQLQAAAEERELLNGRIAELDVVERRYRTLLAHLDASVTWRVGGLVRAMRRHVRSKRQPVGSVD